MEGTQDAAISTELNNERQMYPRWFSQIAEGEAFSLIIKDMVFRSEDGITTFSTPRHGNVMGINKFIQYVESEYHSGYREMMTCLPLLLVLNPKKVLIIGRGGSGVLEEVLRHPDVENVDCYEFLDVPTTTLEKFYAMLFEINDDSFQNLRRAYTDSRVKILKDDDATTVLNGNCGYYDAIILDSFVPKDPSGRLSGEDFLRLVSRALHPEGILCIRGGSIWFHMNDIFKIMKICHQVFSSVKYAWATVPTYPSGVMGFILCSYGDIDFKIPRRSPVISLKYYNSKIRSAAFVLPRFAAFLNSSDHWRKL